jgi:glycosyltransferase involved in cell wall biosynthesis
VVAVPSRRESFSSVTAEALACGTPVVATRCGGPEEILDADCGRLVPVGNSDALADGILGVLAEPERYEADRLRASVVGRFGWDAAVARVGALYDAVLDA